MSARSKVGVQTLNPLHCVWLYGVVLFFSFHFVRDVLQDVGYQTLITQVMVKHSLTVPSWYWSFFNGYAFELAEVVLAIFLLKNKKFGRLGYCTIFLAIFYFSTWLIYWLWF